MVPTPRTPEQIAAMAADELQAEAIRARNDPNEMAALVMVINAGIDAALAQGERQEAA